MIQIKKQIPNLLTLSNLICGVLIIISAFELQFERVAYLAVLALVFDFLDGTVARLLNVSSPMGKELDSFADMVSFGVAPALVLFKYWSNEYFDGTGYGSYFSQTYLNDAVPFVPIIIAAFAGYRLAKFNITEQSTEYFSGLPTPALALAAFAIPLASEQTELYNTWLTHPFFIISFCVLGSILLVSNIKLLSLKLGSQNKTLNVVRIVLLIVCLLLIGLLHFFGAFLCLLVYLAVSLTVQKQY